MLGFLKGAFNFLKKMVKLNPFLSIPLGVATIAVSAIGYTISEVANLSLAHINKGKQGFKTKIQNLPIAEKIAKFFMDGIKVGAALPFEEHFSNAESFLKYTEEGLDNKGQPMTRPDMVRGHCNSKISADLNVQKHFGEADAPRNAVAPKKVLRLDNSRHEEMSRA